MEHHVDPFALPADRLLNLAYHLRVQHLDQKGRETVDRSLADAAQRATLAMSSHRRAGAPDVDRKSLPPPSWWKGEEHAAEMGVALWRQLDSGSVRGT